MIRSDIQILVIDQFNDYAADVQKNLESKTNKHVTIVIEPDVAKAMSKLSDREFDVVLASWEAAHNKKFNSPSDSNGHGSPIVGIIESAELDGNGQVEVNNDFLVKLPVQADVLSQMILNTIENHKLRASLHNTENDLRRLIEKNADSMIVVDEAGVLLFWNEAAQHLFGTTDFHEGELFGLPLTAGETTEIDVVSKRGTRTVAEMRAVDIVWNGARACLATLRDVTQRKLTEEFLEKTVKQRTSALEAANAELKKMYEVANKAAQVRAQFIANFSHEVRTPLGGVVAAAELLPMADNVDEFRELATHVVSSSKQLLSLVESILDFSKLESGSMPLNETDFSLPELIESILISVQKAADKNGVKLESELDVAIPVLVRADAIKIRQVILNLVHNAIKFTSGGVVKVNAELERVQKQNIVKISVQDSGIGMTPNECEHIFQPFVQGNKSIHQNFGGTGLGLSICKQLVTAMNGNISYCTEEGKGSTFWFTVPLKESHLKA